MDRKTTTQNIKCAYKELTEDTEAPLSDNTKDCMMYAIGTDMVQRIRMVNNAVVFDTYLPPSLNGTGSKNMFEYVAKENRNGSMGVLNYSSDEGLFFRTSIVCCNEDSVPTESIRNHILAGYENMKRHGQTLGMKGSGMAKHGCIQRTAVNAGIARG